MSFLGFLSGADEMGTAKGFDINKEDYQIKDADKLFGQSQEQFEAAKARGAGLADKRSAFLGTLEQAAAGNAPSLAVEQLKQNQERSLAQQVAMAQSQRGGNAALAQRSAANLGAQNSASVGQQAMLGRLEESQAAKGMLQQELQNQQAAVDQLTQQYLSMGFDVRSAQQKALQAYNELQVQQTVGIAGINASNERAKGEATGNLVGGLIKGGASMAASGAKG